MDVSKQDLQKISEEIRKITGEETSVNVFVKKKTPKTEDFVMIYQEVGKCLLDDKISSSTLKVFYFFMMNLEFENFIGIDLLTISEKIKMPLPTVKLAMKELKENNFITSIKDNFDRRRNIYRLNPLIAWKGKVKNRQKAIKDNPDQIKLFENREIALSKNLINKNENWNEKANVFDNSN